MSTLIGMTNSQSVSSCYGRTPAPPRIALILPAVCDLGRGCGMARKGKAAVEGPLSGVTAADLNPLLMSVGRLSDDPGSRDEALDMAQEKAFEAMEAPTAAKRIALAREALALSARCADAYLILARETEDAGEALDLCRRAVAAGEEALGAAAFEDDVGLFWGLLETRPYMRARHEFALALWASGALRRGDRALSGHAAPQSRRQSGHPLPAVGCTARTRSRWRGGGVAEGL